MHIMIIFLAEVRTCTMQALDLQANSENAGNAARLGSELKNARDLAEVSPRDLLVCWYQLYCLDLQLSKQSVWCSPQPGTAVVQNVICGAGTGAACKCPAGAAAEECR